ncbi:MAG: hypothetical protein LBU65_08340 [Planctomycetaceae bacterium]|nr:hypothetical protein [Planctomycetaceae bacterium]
MYIQSFQQIKITIFFIAIIYCTLLCNVANAETYSLEIKSNSEVDKLMNAHNFSKAEELAREKKLDVRVIATIMAYAGKKDEAFTMFSEYIRSAPDEMKKSLSFQTINLLSGADASFGKEFFDELVHQKILILDANEILCGEVALLTRNGQIAQAEQLFEQVLDTSYADDNLVHTAMPLLAKMNLDTEKQQKVMTFLEILLKKFPDNLDVRLQWIDSLASREPSKALIEINSLRDMNPDFYSQMESIIHLIRGKTLENLGEIDRAKTEFTYLLGTDYELVAKGKINEYEVRKNLEKELQEKVTKLSEKPKYELPPPPPRSYFFIIAINVITIVVIIVYLVSKHYLTKK